MEEASQECGDREAFFDAADDLSDLHSEASVSLLASSTPHRGSVCRPATAHSSFTSLRYVLSKPRGALTEMPQVKNWMAGNDDAQRNSINQIDEYEAVLSQLSGQSGAVGKAAEATSRVDEETMIPRVLSIIQSTQNRVSEARLQSHRTITQSVTDTTTVGISYTDLKDHATGQRDFIVGAFYVSSHGLFFSSC